MTFIATKLFHKAGEGSGGGGDQHNLGWYATESALTTAHATASDGDWAIVGSTDTVWVWDSDTTAWKDTDTKGQVTSVNGQTGVVSLGINDVAPTQTGKSGYVLGTDGFVAGWVKPEIVQVSAVPVASEDEVDNIYQFVGTTDANYTNGYFYKCVSDGQNPATYSWSNVQVQASSGGLPSQTGNSGKFLTTDGTDASWSDKPLVNNATQSTSLVISDTSNTTNVRSVVVGREAKTTKNWNVVIGPMAQSTGQDSITIGQTPITGAQYVVNISNNMNIRGSHTTFVGPSSVLTQLQASYSVILGSIHDVSNIDNNSFYVGLSNTSAGQYKLLGTDGTIPTARLTKVNTTITLAAADWSAGTQTVTVNGVTSTSVVFVAPDPADTTDYVSAGILCTSQTTNSLTFTATTTPTNDIDVNIVCL